MSGTPGLSGSARAVIAAQKSAEGIVAGPPAKARTTDRVIRTAGSCGPSGRTSSWNWPWSRRRGVKPGAPETEGPKPVWRVPTPNARRLSSTGSASPPCEAVPQLKSVEPPCTDPYARWCGRGGAVRLPPIPISAQGSKGRGRKKASAGTNGGRVSAASRAQSGARTAPALTRADGRGRAHAIRAKKGSAAGRPAAGRNGNGAGRNAMRERYAGRRRAARNPLSHSRERRPAGRALCPDGLRNISTTHGNHDRT